MAHSESGVAEKVGVVVGILAVFAIAGAAVAWMFPVMSAMPSSEGDIYRPDEAAQMLQQDNATRKVHRAFWGGVVVGVGSGVVWCLVLKRRREQMS